MHAEFQAKTKLNGHEGKYLAAKTISGLINAEQHMVHIEPKTIYTYMKHGLATWLVDDGGNVGGFIKAMPWNPNLTQIEGGMEKIEAAAIQNIDKDILPTGIESGSLLVPPQFRKHGYGTLLKDQLAKQILAKYPGIPLFSVVDKENSTSIHLNQKMGWIQLDSPQLDALMNIVGMDILQGWDAHIFLHPDCLTIIQQ